MRKRKVLSVLLCAGLIISSVLNANFFANAQVNPTVYSDMNGSSVNAGETIRVPVSIRDNSGLMGWMLTFNYDADVFTPVSVDTGDVINGGIQDSIGGNAVEGSFNVYWAGSENEYYNGVMIYLNLSVNSKAVGNSSIGIAFSQQDTFDADFEDVYLNCENIELNVKNSGYTQYAKVNAFADDVTAGEETDIKLNISEINNVSVVSISINYDSQNFTFVSASSNGTELKSTGSDGTVKLTVSNITESLNNTNFAVVKFKCKDKAKSGKYDFSVSSTDEGIICKGCNITVKPSATSETAEIYADKITANYGETITIPVQIENNHGIMGYRLDFKYDADMLEPISASCGEDFLQNGQFNNSIGVKDGEFKVLWNNVDEIYSNGTLLTLKFKVLAEEKTDTVISMTYSQPDTFNENYQNVVFDCRDINVKLNNECKHSFEKYVYNGDARYTSSTDYSNGTQTRTCSKCGINETIEAPNTALLRRRGTALSLESSITLTIYITKDVVDYYDDVYAEFTRNSKTEIVRASDKTFESGSTIYSIFNYTGISPQAMGDDVEVVFYGVKDGVKYWGNPYFISATSYIQNMLNKDTSSAKLKTMLVDLLYYGEACQIYQNYKTDNLMTNILTDEQKQLRSTGELKLNNIRDFSYKTCNNRLVRLGTALRLSNAVEMAIPLNMTDVTLEELTMKVKIGTRDLEYTYIDNPENFKKEKDGYWYFYFDGVYANQMSDEVFITSYRGEEQVSYTLKYSVESYASAVTDAKLKNVTDAMMRYGNSAKAYSGK